MQEVNWIDNVVYGIVLLSVMFGAWRGLFASLFGIAAVVLAIFTTIKGLPHIAPYVAPALADSAFTPLLSGCAVFLIVYLMFAAAGRVIVTGIKKIDLFGLDFIGGMVFGLARGGLFALIFILLASIAVAGSSPAWQTSQTVPMAGGLLARAAGAEAMRPYQKWLHFDSKRRPRLVDNSPKPPVAAAEEKKGEDPGSASPPKALTGKVEDIRAEQTRQDETLTEVLDELENTGTGAHNVPSTLKGDELKDMQTLEQLKLMTDYAMCEMRGGRQCQLKPAAGDDQR